MSNLLVFLFVSTCASFCAGETVYKWVMKGGLLCHKKNVNESDFHDDCNAYCRDQIKCYGSGRCDIQPQNVGKPDPPWHCKCITTQDALTSCVGDPHCRSFDGLYWHPQPHGEYLWLRSKPENDPLGELQPFKLFVTTRGPIPDSWVTGIDSIRFEIYGQEFVSSGFSVLHNNIDITSQLPYLFAAKGLKDEYSFVQIYKIGSYFRIETDIGVRIMIAPRIVGGPWGNMNYATLFVRIPKTMDFLGNVDGMLGEFNVDGNPNNDLVYPDGRLSHGDSPVGWSYDMINAWAADALPVSGAPKKLPTDCGGRGGKFRKQFCEKYFLPSSKNTPFKECFAANMAIAKRSEEELKSCSIDACGIVEKEDTDATILEKIDLCRPMEEIEGLCKAAGQTVPDWRRPGFCGEKCKNGAVFKKCSRAPVKTCAKANKREIKPFGQPDCVAGCVCPRNRYLNEENGKCVSKKQCPQMQGQERPEQPETIRINFGTPKPSPQNPRPNPGPNARPDAAPNASPNSGPNASPNTGPNTSPNSGPNASPNTGPNASPNSGPNVSPNTGSNSSPNSGPNPRPYVRLPDPNPSPNFNPNSGPNPLLNVRANPALFSPISPPNSSPNVLPDVAQILTQIFAQLAAQMPPPKPSPKPSPKSSTESPTKP